MDLPIELFLSFIAFAVVMGIIGLWKRIPIMMFIAGAVITFWAITTDNIILGQNIDASTNTILPTSIDYMLQPTSTGFTSLRNASNIFIGEEVVNTNSALYNKEINDVTVRIKKTGSPTGTVSIGVWSSNITPTSSNYKFLLGTVDSSTLPSGTVSESVTMTSSSTYTLQEFDAVGVFFEEGSVGNTVDVYNNATASSFDGTNSRRTVYASSWSDSNSADMRMDIRLITIEERTVNTISDNAFPFEEYPKILFGLIASIFMLAGALIWKYEEN